VRAGAAVRHYFIEAYTPFGQISLLEEFLAQIKYTYLFTGGPGTGKSTMIKLIGIELIDRGFNVEYIRSVKEPDSVAGLYLRKQKLCILDRNEFVPEILIRSEYQREIDFNSFCQQSKLAKAEQKIAALVATLQSLEHEIILNLQRDYLKEEDLKVAQLVLNKAGSIHNFLPIWRIANFENQRLLPEQSRYNEIMEIISQIQQQYLSYYFLQALRLDKWLNLAPHFIKDYDLICLDSEGTVHMLPELLQEVKHLRQEIELIVHPLKPYAIIGMIFPEKNLTVWKGNPHKLEEQGFHPEHSPDLLQVLERYKTCRFDLKTIYNTSVNFSRLDELREQIVSCIMADLRK